MEFTWRFLRCPNCGKVYNWHVDKLFYIVKMRTRLGPPSLRCASCGTVFVSGLQEWARMSPSQRTRFAILSLLDSLFVGFSLTLPTFAVIGYATNTSDPQFPSFGLVSTSVAAYALLVLALQVVRVILSNRRAESVVQEPVLVSFFSWQTNLQFYAVVVCSVGILLFFYITFVLR